MEERRLRYSERKRLAETGSLGDLSDQPSVPLRHAVAHAFDRTYDGATIYIRDRYMAQLQDECEEHFGWTPGRNARTYALDPDSVEDFLDYLEILVEVGDISWRYREGAYIREAKAWANVAADLNRLFDRHRFAYRVQRGEIHRVSSPALSETIVGPALLAIQRTGWEQVERSFREALMHQRGGADENDDALTAATAALEAAMKAAGLSGNTIGDLAKSFKKAGWSAPMLQGVPDALDTLLKTSAALRNIHGDAHGKYAGAPEVDSPLVDLTINIVGALIVYLAAVAP